VPKKSKDYTVSEIVDVKGRTKWKVLCAKVDVITTCNSLEHAVETANKLNDDPWALMRGQTRKERNQ
tara:strand:+ start:1011 stop:1211 length:201 start_codon:yes stop_codon:yes gene_type:complete